MATERKNKIRKLYKDAQKTNDEIILLEDINLFENSVDYIKGYREVTLYENRLLSGSTLIDEYFFEDLSDEDIQFIKSVVMFETTDGFEMNEYLVFNHFATWKKIQDIHQLTVRVSGYIFDLETFSSTTIPVYLTAKLIVHNNKNFRVLQKMKE